MTDVVEDVQPVTEEVVDQEGQQPQQVNVDEMQIAYLVGLQPDGNFFFQVFGKSQGLVELLGLHTHATQRLQVIQQQKMGTGDALVVELAKGLQAMDQKLDALLKNLVPKTPDNSL